MGLARARPWCAPALRARGVVCPDRPVVALRQENSENSEAFTSSELPGGQHGPGPGGLPPVALQTDDYGDGGGSAKKASVTTSAWGSNPVTLGVPHGPRALWLRLFGVGTTSWDVLGSRKRKERARSARFGARNGPAGSVTFCPDR